MKCPYCGSEVGKNDKFCGKCGRVIELKRKKLSKRKMILYIIVVLVGLLSIAAYIGLISIEFTPTTTPAIPAATPIPTLSASVEVLKMPSTVVAGRPFEIAWKVNSPIETTINHTAVHYGPEPRYPPLDLKSYLYISDILTGSIPSDFSTKITIKNVGDYNTGVLYFRAHAIIDGVSYWSEEKTIVVQSTSSTFSPPTISVISYPGYVKGDTNFTIRWTVFGGAPGIIHQTSIFWGYNSGGRNITDYARKSTIQSGYTPAAFSAELKAPSGGIIYFRIHALVDETELYSPENKITID